MVPFVNTTETIVMSGWPTVGDMVNYFYFISNFMFTRGTNELTRVRRCYVMREEGEKGPSSSCCLWSRGERRVRACNHE